MGVSPDRPMDPATTPLWAKLEDEWLAMPLRSLGTHSPIRITYATVNRLIKDLMVLVGEDPYFYSTHSLRIGGATALFAQGANETIIRTMGRWSSDIHRLCVRACFEQCCNWTRQAGSATHSCLAEFDEVDDY